ncbi:ABC transporter permease [Pinirhizobacter sp.]|jgi:putative ABC transport system permease protein|uniref:ABC transporter permease n=1 Tax=Pinirhizobacter sp. TaxID=2950432 RepID=UPI002F413ED2
MAVTRAIMQLRPILAALSRHKVATLLIVLQVALTLAVTSNALFIVATRVVHLSRASGVDESHLFAIRNGWKGGQNATQIDANIRADLEALRHVSGVRDVFSSQAYPLENYGVRLAGVRLKADQTKRPPVGVVYLADEHAIDTLGVTLEEGRNFRPEEVSTINPDGAMSAPGIIITRSLADKIFPDGQGLGKTVYLPGGPSTVIGIIASLQSPLTTTHTLDGDSILLPARSSDPDGVVYLVRTQSTGMTPVMAAALKSLEQRGGMRIVDPNSGAVTLATAREHAYATDRSVATLLSIVCGLLLLATAGGIVGLSSFWVSQRRTQIGIRRSLGATTGDILRYFHAENFLIVSGGVVLGLVLAVLANIGLMNAYPLQVMPLYVPAIGALVLWGLGQLAVWGPASYAAKVPPVVAIRTI